VSEQAALETFNASQASLEKIPDIVNNASKQKNIKESF